MPLLAAGAALKEYIRPYLRRAFLCLFPNKRPNYFSDCWRHPFYELRSGLPGDALRAAARGSEPDLLFLPMNDWHTRIQRSQQLAGAFARLGHRAVYFNPHLGFEYPAPYLANRGSRLAILGPRLLEFHTRLPREHVFHKRMPAPAESRRIAAAALELAAALDLRRAVQIVSFPMWLETALAIRAALGFPIVYDCHDYLGGFENVAHSIVAAEPRLLAVADLVVFSSAPLMESTLAADPTIRPKALLLRNAVDADRFQAPATVSRSARKTVAYVGAIERWLDVDAVRTAALEHPEFEFVLVGRVEEPRARQLEACPNVVLAGEMPYSELPAFLARSDAAMIPFLRNPLTVATNPIKLYEYFSQGLPVVSARLPEVEQFSDMVYLADNVHEFSAQVARAVAENDPALRERRIAVARQESWTARARDLLAAVPQRPGAPARAVTACD